MIELLTIIGYVTLLLIGFACVAGVVILLFGLPYALLSVAYASVRGRVRARWPHLPRWVI